eukprot:gene10631-10702_t
MRDLGTFDLVVIGGGINGAGIARDALGRGLSVLLVEKDDLAQGTSSRSGKLVHGGLRYLEYYEFRLVREALIEREILMNAAPHIIWPMRFVLPHSPEQRPAWMIRIGLFLYDHLGGRKKLPPTRSLDLATAPEGKPIRSTYRKAFEYSDCWVDDARLVVLNALDVQKRGGTVKVRTPLVAARREGALWHVELRDTNTDTPLIAHGKCIVNAAGPWVENVLRNAGSNAENRVRLVKGSHIVTRKFWEGDQAYLLQNTDNRVIFVNPYEGDLCLIGTTDIPFDGKAEDVKIMPDEVDYLLGVVNRYFKTQLQPDDVVHSFSGVRPLYDDNADNPSAVTRDYVFDVDAPQGLAPILSVFGGKITTYRKLAEHALDKLKVFFPNMAPAWTQTASLPGGDMPDADFDRMLAALRRTHSFLPQQVSLEYGRRYGTRADDMLRGAKSIADLGVHFGGTFFEREARFLIAEEWAQTADDILSRRTKHGLHLTEAENVSDALGIDIGTSGVRAAVLDAEGQLKAMAAKSFASLSTDPTLPETWWQAALACLGELNQGGALAEIAALAVDGTSGTMLAIDADGHPVGPSLMYNMTCDDADILGKITEAAPHDSPALGRTSALARVLMLQDLPDAQHVIHQADWLAGRLSGLFARSDENNALKTGYDPLRRCWPDWIVKTGAKLEKLPQVLPPGAIIGPVNAAAQALGLPASAVVCAGTTDGCASFLATGAANYGEGVTALGSTLVIKILSDEPISAPQYGIYSHRLGNKWLVGGASNTGGKVIEHLFASKDLAELTAHIKPDAPTGLNYYPLITAGERFPIQDAALQPRLTPRPDDDAVFFQAVLEGIAEIEALAYRRLGELGAPKLKSVRSVGGGANNKPWSQIRQYKLGVPFEAALSQEACVAAFNVFFIDQFGVLHDGHAPYAGAVKALEGLKARDARIVILSNSGRSGTINAKRLAKLGFPSSLYDYFVTSGDVAADSLRDGKLPIDISAETRCFTISTGGTTDLVDELGLSATLTAEDADLVVISGSQSDTISLDAYRAALEPAARRNVPCICTNPDRLMLTPRGNMAGAGAIADIYEELGGMVHWIGKPYSGIYRAAAHVLGGPASTEILCIGDSIEHDIVGAKRFGAKSALVRTGILADLTIPQICG